MKNINLLSITCTPNVFLLLFHIPVTFCCSSYCFVQYIHFSFMILMVCFKLYENPGLLLQKYLPKFPLVLLSFMSKSSSMPCFQALSGNKVIDGSRPEILYNLTTNENKNIVVIMLLYSWSSVWI